MMMKLHLRVSLPIYVAILLSVPQGVFSQTPRLERQKPPTFKVESGLILVDVTVRDRYGNIVDDLRQADFTILEDGVPQEIITFALEKVPVTPAAISVRDPAGVPEVPIMNLSEIPEAEFSKEDLQNKRLIILFFDLSSLDTETLIRSVETAQKFVSEESNGHNLMAVAIYSSTLELLQDLTNDREVLMSVLEGINPTESGDAPEEDISDEESSDEVYVPDDIQFNVFNTDRRLSALETVAKMYREFPERKSLIYFSSGMTTTGIENQSQIRSTVDVSNQSNMSIYTVDSRGLVALPPGGGASRGSAGGRAMFSGSAVTRQMANLYGSQETLGTLAFDTGGEAFQDVNDLGLVFNKVLEDTQSYYVLGYYSSNTKPDGKFRKVKVVVDRSDIKLVHRPGYFAMKEFTKWTQTERDRQLEEALAVDRPFSDVPFILQADYFMSDGKNSQVPLSIQLAGDGVQFETKGSRREAQFELLAQIADPEGKVAGVARDTVRVRLPAQSAEKIQGGQIIYSTNFDLRPGDYDLVFLIRDNRTGRLGTFSQSITVPTLDGKNLETSSIVLASRLVDARANSRGVEHQGPGRRFRRPRIRQDPLEFKGQKVIPSIGNVFLSLQTLYVYFQVYGSMPDPENGKPRLSTSLLLLHENRKVLGSKSQLVEEWTKENVATVAMALPLRGLKKGTYTLQVNLRDVAAGANLFRRVPLVIE
jgi:VWFA-related protein